MTLRQYRALTADVDATLLRDAMTAALLVEVPHDRYGYQRFYTRVVDAVVRPTAVAPRPRRAPARKARVFAESAHSAQSAHSA